MKSRSLLLGVVGGLALLLSPAGSARGKDANGAGEGLDVILRVTCPSDALKATVEAKRGELLACLDERAQKQGAFSATSVFEWTVRADGRVANAASNSMSAEYEDPELRDCVLARIARWTFPRQDEPVEVTLVAAFTVKRPSASSADERGTAPIEKVALRKVVEAHAPEIVKCYEARLSQDPRLSGKVVLKWVVNASGAAENVVIADGTTLEDHALQECMKARVASWKFPKPANGGVATVTYPWLLRPGP